MNVKNVIIDCDPSADDAIAIMLALASPELNVLGITTVSGVCHVDQSTENALKILELCGETQTPVARGAAQPLQRTMKFDAAYGGTDGMAEVNLPLPAVAVCEQPAVEFIIRKAMEYAGRLHIISTAPMTNIAAALTAVPELSEQVCSIITSSGSYGVAVDLTHKNPRPTWNICQDPEAAKIVMESGILIEAIGLDVSSRLHNHMTDILLAYGDKDKPSKALFRKAVSFNLKHGLEPYSLLVDSMAVAYATQPGIAKLVEGRVAVETKGELTTGQTLFGNCGYLDHMQSKCKAAYEFDQDAFVRLLSERVF